jgi:hypothetical protein
VFAAAGVTETTSQQLLALRMRIVLVALANHHESMLQPQVDAQQEACA